MTKGGYVFFYSNRKYLETNDIYDTLIGNAPLLLINSQEKWFSQEQLIL